MAINIIQGTDVEINIRMVDQNDEPIDLTGLATDKLELKLPGEDNDLALTLTANANGSVLSITSALAGKFKATISDSDTPLLATGEGKSGEVTMQFGGGPDYDVKRSQLVGQFNVKKSLFD